MNPEDKLRSARLALGLSFSEMADLIGYTGPNANDRIREIERGKKPVVGPLNPLIDYLTQGIDTGDSGVASVVLSRYLPRFVELEDLAGTAGDFEAVMHTRFPRFIAVFSNLLPEPHQARLTTSGLASIEAPVDTELGRMVAVPIDAYNGDFVPLLKEAAKAKFGRS